ncbi:tRNA 2-selenouridine(34) synthase MnmH [Carboxylicivirga sp. N1Y90]|uniref:tRNA 2-selenouridine(34) synthase MnmH n=1 Tax=Carboxylicivirga fragile TaxID=3417571 RepID=UPI003D346C0B|nr:tRNA 2-selenouridine(34) synthase MnmH [Marinilabiliaceae bacterium N1Y90]
MPQDISIETYLKQYQDLALIDVRSPGEFDKGHIPSAINIPLFSNDERAHVGTVYKQQSKEKAIELGYTYVNPKLEDFISQSLKAASNKKAVIHCWRGGMRSHAFAQHLSDNGFEEVYVIKHGYKAYRRLALNSFGDHQIKVLGGYTGSGKTHILHQIKARGKQVLDLEKLANHKGSAFGSIGQDMQPSTEQFENNIYWQWRLFDKTKPVWLEDESPNIGNVNIPMHLFRKMREVPLIFVDIKKEERANHLVEEYADKTHQEKLIDSVQRISKRLGHEATSKALNNLKQGNYYDVALLTLNYYDKYYLRGMNRRDAKKINILKLDTIDHAKNAQLILEFADTI